MQLERVVFLFSMLLLTTFSLQTAEMCLQCIRGGANRYWCPSNNECQIGDARTMYERCQADQYKGQWTAIEADCHCLNATVRIPTSCGTYVNHAYRGYIGTESGPRDLTCPVGQWMFSDWGLFNSEYRGMWIGSMSLFTDRCDRTQIERLTLFVSDTAITIPSLSEVYTLNTKHTDFVFSGYSGNGSPICLYFNPGKNILKMSLDRSNGECPDDNSYHICSLSDSFNSTSSTIMKIDATAYDLPSQVLQGTFSQYSTDCSALVSASVTVEIYQTASLIVINFEDSSQVIIRSVVAISQTRAFGWIDNIMVCLYLSNADGIFELQHMLGGQCPDGTSQVFYCSLSSRISAFRANSLDPSIPLTSSPESSQIPTHTLAWLYFLLAAIIPFILAFIVAGVIFLVNCMGNHDRKYRMVVIPKHERTYNLQNGRCQRCYIYKDHHSPEICRRFSTTLKFLKAESEPELSTISVRSIPLSYQSNSYKSIEDWLRLSWSNKNDFQVDRVKSIVIYHNPELYEKYYAYLELMKGKETMQWHGSSQQNLMKIAQEGFSLSKASTNISWSRFGNGIYFATNSSKSHEYSIGFSSTTNALGSNRTWPLNTGGLLLCRVAVGRPKGFKKNSTDLKYAPFGHTAVEGIVGKELNYPELVVYDERAILPVCYVEYTYKILF